MLGRNVKEFDRDAFITEKDLYHVGTDNNQTLLTDQNSGELLLAPSDDISIQTLLTNEDGSSFVSATNQTAIDIEQAEDGSIKLLSYVEAYEITKTVKKKVTKRVGNRNRTVTVKEDVQETVPAAFVITTFDSSGDLIQETTQLNAADPLTYEAEKLFGIDLNKDNVLGRFIKPFDRDAFTTANNIETFSGASDNKTLLTDQNSGELLFSDLSDPSLQNLLTYSDGSSFVPTSNQTAIDIEQTDGGCIKLLSYREAGDAINVVTKNIKKKVTTKVRGRNRTVTVTEEVLSPCLLYTSDAADE